MPSPSPTFLDDVEACVDAILSRVGSRIVLGTPLGLGKPNHLLNAVYRRAKADPSLRLTLMTGLSLARPKMHSELEKRFLGPIIERVFGDSPDLDYVGDYATDRLPENIEVVEFFLNTGQLLGRKSAQQHYISSNYTLVGRDMMIQGVNVFAQSITKRQVAGETRFSLSSNTDSLDLFPLLRADERKGRKVAVVGQVNERLPFMYGDAMVPPETFDLIVDNRRYDHTLLGPPGPPVELADHAIGLNATALIKDGGTLQIGIGSLGDAIAYGCCLRHRDPASFQAALDAIGVADASAGLIAEIGGTAPFETGLYGNTEMFCDGYRHLYEAGVLKREVFDDPTIQELLNEGTITPEITPAMLDLLVDRGAVGERLGAEDVAYLQKLGVFKKSLRFESDRIVTADGIEIGADLGDAGSAAAIRAHCLAERLEGGTILHAGFFLGPQAMYAMLRDLDESESRRFCMTHIRYVNQLYGHQRLATLQRRDARFMNTTMIATLMGAVCSDGLENGQVVSGVGGQYNFVAMAHALEGARSILLLHSTRTSHDAITSNIVWNYGYITIPRHLRDIVVTEYGIADLRGRQDQEVIAALLNISDSRFQEALRMQAVSAGKLPDSYRIPDRFRRNSPARIEASLAPFRRRGLFGPYPFGSDLTGEEQVLGKVLTGIKARLGRRLGMVDLVKDAVAAPLAVPKAAVPYLVRLGLDRPSQIRETMLRRIIVSELKAGGYL